MIRLLMSGLLLAAAPVVDTQPIDPVLHTLMEGDAAQAHGDPDTLIDMAQLLDTLGAKPAEGQEDLAALWTREASDHGANGSPLAYRGRALGPAYRRGSLNAGGTVTMRQLFFAGQRAQISVAPSGPTAKLSVRVRNADGGTLCAKPVGGPQADCAWMPIFTDRFDIVIANSGAEPAAFYLVVR